MTEYKMTLSTTEPNSNVGLIKLRHADVNSQAIVAQIVENGQPKSFEGLQPFFCLMAQEITGQGVSEEKVISFDAFKGTLSYIASDNALQMIGQNEAYFSFRRQVGEQWIEQFSTRSFNYIVEKSIYSQPFKDSNYWWTFNELYLQFESWFNNSKAIINALDPTGKMLSEIITARGTYSQLVDRLEHMEKQSSDSLGQIDEQLTSRINEVANDLKSLVDAVVGSEEIDVVENETDLHDKYPQGKKGIVFTRDNAHYWYYVNGEWIDGGSLVKNPTYSLLDTDGTYINLNSLQSWKDNPNITSLKTGYYCAYIQTNASPDSQEQDPNVIYPDPKYPIALNFPIELNGVMCSIKVTEYPKLSENFIRVDYEVWANYSNKKWFSTKRLDGTLSDWKQSLTHNSISNPSQIYQLTYSSGVSLPFKKASNDVSQMNSNDLKVDITSLNSGFFMGSINKDPGDTEGFNTIKRLKLPTDFPLDQVCSVMISRTDTNRKVIQLSALYTSATWIGTTGINNSLIAWKRIDQNASYSELDMAEFVYQFNEKKETDSALLLMMTDTHAQDKDLTTQKSFVNPTLFDDYEVLSKSLDYVDYHIHLGDWIDGNTRPELSRVSMVKYTNRFYKLDRSYGIIGNHDWNGIWGEIGQKVPYFSDGYFSKKDVQRYFIPKKAMTDKTYYYIDDDKHKFRMIFLNTYDVTLSTYSSGKVVTSPQNQPAIMSEQVKWLIKTLQEIPLNYDVIVLGHAPIKGVFSSSLFYNGDVVREILEKFQVNGNGTISETDIDESNPDFPSYQLSEEYDFSNNHGNILGVFNGHIHKDATAFKNGIRYISLLCARPESGVDESKPARNYYDSTKNAISAIEIVKDKKIINLYRYGAGKNYTFNSLSE